MDIGEFGDLAPFCVTLGGSRFGLQQLDPAAFFFQMLHLTWQLQTLGFS